MVSNKSKKFLVFKSDEKKTFKIHYIGEDTKRNEFFEDITKRKEGIFEGLQVKKKGPGEDPLILFKWNEEGLHDRIATAAAAGLTTRAGNLVAKSDDMKDAIVHFLCSGPNAGVDLGGHHDLIQFLSNSRLRRRMDELLTQHTYLKHHGGQWPGVIGAHNWRNIVDYLQILDIIKSNVAVGPVDDHDYFIR